MPDLWRERRLMAGTGHRILLVDDEITLRAMLAMILERLGLVVTSASHAEEALATLAAEPDGFDAVVTDHALPGASGLELALQVAERNPGLPVLLLTGQSVTHLDAEARARFAAVLSKPVEAREIERAIDEAVRRARG